MSTKMFKRILSGFACFTLVFGVSSMMYVGKPVKAATYYKGADLSWLPGMESKGYTFKNAKGTTQDEMTIMKGLGVSAVRLRIWVNPSSNPYNGMCNEAEVITMAKRAKAIGAAVMLDFQYSDSWADPGKQTLPAAWAGDTTISMLGTQVYNYTYQVMTDMKNAGVTPTWVQIGNETNAGMLWPLGNTSNGFSNVAWLINSGYNAVKAVSNSTQCIVHLSNGYDNANFRWFFDGVKAAGGKWDIIGMSLYPTASNYTTYNRQCLTNMKDMKSRYGTNVVISEAGFSSSDPTNAAKFLSQLKTNVISVGGVGIFYWEPECYNWNSYGMGATDSSTLKATAAMSAY
ncbi:glycoside hydrolase family 53 protein [Clostridium estertheticum]|uniref:glycoside hydrolase family 53 protein n=1 Tax=Clostridium estertheticum TaxID=238834 RepID=UPI001C7CFFDD|nr:glycosyl hydrolase 53 family protein [Clostridium estertheticum]MBX4264574.1 arabinogalactan endo-1,4-beta-galactosidase [Clostridium estertheticum]WLC88716.1 arabinogalactan endo-1,4-beta-galactosidase [Clostridium estertheticum]